MVRIFRHYVPKSLLVLGGGEAAILFGSVYLGVTHDVIAPKVMVGEVWTKGGLYAGTMLFAMAVMGLYQRYLRDDLRGILFRTGLALLAGLMLCSVVLSVEPALGIGTPAFAITFVVSAAAILGFRAAVFHYTGNALFRRRVLVLGAGSTARQVEELRRRVDRQDMSLVGFVAVPGSEGGIRDNKILPLKTTLLDLVLEHDVNEIVVALDEKRANFPLSQILDCKMRGVRINDLVTFFEQQTGKIKLDALDPATLIFSEGFIQAVLRGYSHRLFDVLLSLATLALVWPFMLLTAVLVWIEDGFGAPILYRQLRVGRDGRTFEVFKFRSMHVDAEAQGARWASTNDARVTRVGSFIRKTRIDELPQLINVLKGEMSFVGPRPERPEFVAELSRKIPYYDLRHRVNPGITGWAQICYPYGSSERDAKEKLQFDLYYIKNYSLFLDLMILIQTAQVMIWGKGAR